MTGARTLTAFRISQVGPCANPGPHDIQNSLLTMGLHPRDSSARDRRAQLGQRRHLRARVGQRSVEAMQVRDLFVWLSLEDIPESCYAS